MPEFDNHDLPAGTTDSWRTWLMTGVRRPPVDRRRIRGAHKGLKRMLAEGMSISAEKPYSWKEFSDALVRQSVGDAVRQLPAREAQVVKLAYFGRMTNHEIADRLDISVAGVERRLRDAIARISRHVEQGQAMGRRAIGAVIVWLSGRWLGDATHHVAQIGAVATVAVIFAVQPAAEGAPEGASRPHHAQLFGTPRAREHVESAAPPHASALPVPAQAPAIPDAKAGAPAVPVTLPSVPVTLPAVSVTVPAVHIRVPRIKLPLQPPLRS
ncbi:MAG TPA: sigma-70 family RNA polymerase sigma factor [Candidatus Dormibacteraeota bacterium]|nr:sigma-70 family RNA polymerase sigma factor [Candidatus Dormibacteraeota bacterium]